MRVRNNTVRILHEHFPLYNNSLFIIQILGSLYRRRRRIVLFASNSLVYSENPESSRHLVISLSMTLWFKSEMSLIESRSIFPRTCPTDVGSCYANFYEWHCRQRADKRRNVPVEHHHAIRSKGRRRERHRRSCRSTTCARTRCTYLLKPHLAARSLRIRSTSLIRDRSFDFLHSGISRCS